MTSCHNRNIGNGSSSLWTSALLLGVGAVVGAALTRSWSARKRKFRRVAVEQQPTSASTDGHSCCHPDLKKHSKLFSKKKILRIEGTSNVYVAIGYAIANCIILDGNDDGLVIIDVTESVQAGQEVLADFRALYKNHKPVAGIIYTHFHTDHTGGTDAFRTKDNFDKCQIWGHVSTGPRMSQFNTIMGPIAFLRGAKQFGTYLEKEHGTLENCGIGPFLRQSNDDQMSLSNLPTHTYDTPQQKIVIAGIHLTLIHAPGETQDQTVVLMETDDKYSRRLLFCADNYYESFPNLYPIRGAPHRDTLQWARSIDIMLATRPDILVPSHTLPQYGAATIKSRLIHYRDAIQYVHDQTVRHMLEGYHPDEIAAMVQLPSNLRRCEYLKEFYGTVAWSAKGIFHGYLGWFSGDECDLNKLAPSEYAQRLVSLAGDCQGLLTKAQQAMQEQDYQWALELSSALLRLQDNDSNTHRPSASIRKQARQLKTDCCRILGQSQISANGRNWYLTSALLNDGQIEIKPPAHLQKELIFAVPLEQLFQLMTVRLKADSNKLVGKMSRVCFEIIKDDTDTDDNATKSKSNGTVVETWTLFLRNSVLRCEKNMPAAATFVADVKVITTDQALRQLFASPLTSAPKLIATGKFQLARGSTGAFLQFLSLFDMSL